MELIMALMQEGNRTESEEKAYQYLPKCMKRSVERSWLEKDVLI